MEQVTLEQYIEKHGYTKKQWEDTVEMLCKKGFGNGVFQDYNLTNLVISWLFNYKCVV